MSLPAVASLRADDGGLPPAATGAEPASSAPIRVLFADDSPAVRTLARYSLTAGRGFCLVAEAADGAEAVALTARHVPDCVILDVQMPKMDGFEALDAIQRRFPDIPVVMLSGYSSEATMAQASTAGAAAYLDKGTQLAELADTVRRVIADGRDAAPVPTPPVRRVPLTVAESQLAAGTTSTPSAPTASPSTAAEAVSPSQGSTGVDAVADPPPAAPAATKPQRSAEEDLRRFEYVVSHDLAEPLRIMAGFATLLSTRYGSSLDDTAQVFLGHLVSGAARMQGMIDDLLGYGRAGKATARLQTVDLEDAVRRAYGGLRTELDTNGVVATAGALPAVVADPTMLDTVLRQLVLNAITFTAAAVPTVHIEAQVVGALATIEVHDNGIGIAPSDHARVFELFQRLHTREEYPGTGTGLALVRRLLDLQGGDIALGSSARGGTVVTITLPPRRRGRRVLGTPGATYAVLPAL